MNPISIHDVSNGPRGIPSIIKEITIQAALKEYQLTPKVTAWIVAKFAEEMLLKFPLNETEQNYNEAWMLIISQCALVI